MYLVQVKVKSQKICRRRLSAGLAVVLIAALLSLISANIKAKTLSQNTIWCQAHPAIVDDFGWNPDKLLDPLYQMFFDPLPGNVDIRSVRIYVYYDNDYVSSDVARLDGWNESRGQWQFGIDSTWAWLHWNWKTEEKWRLDYDCTGAQPAPKPTNTPIPVTPPTPTPPPATNGIEIVKVSSHVVHPGEQFSPSVTIRVTSGNLDPGRGDHLHATPEDYTNTLGAYPVQPLRRMVKSGETFTFDVANDSAFRMVAPQTPGTYLSVWHMRIRGEHTGPQIIFRITVDQPSVNNHAPGQPQLKSPGDWSEVRSEQAPELCWEPVNDPDGDPVQYWAEVLESAVNDSSGWIGSTCWRPNNLFGKYFGYQWRVKARDNRGAEGNWSNRWHFTLSPPSWNPPPPTATPQSIPTQPSVSGNWWDSAYAYRRPLSISSDQTVAAGTLIRVDGLDLGGLIDQGKIRSDYADLRVVRRTDAGYWQEVARVVYTDWDIEFQLLAPLNPDTADSYYLYYGNPHAGSPPSFSLPQGWWVDMHRTKWWDSYSGTWEHTSALDFDNICNPPLDHRGRTGGSAFDDSDRFRGRIFLPFTGAWTFRIYTNDGYYLRINGGEIGHYSGYDGNRWITVGSTTLKAGWYEFDAGNMWVNCGAWKLAMEGPGFPNQIVPAHYFQKVWGNVRSGVSVGEEDPYLKPTPTPTPQPDCAEIEFNGVSLYADPNCQGDRREFAVRGVYNLNDFDNTVTSIYVPDGWSVRVFALPNGGGYTACISEPIWNLVGKTYDNGNDLLNDSISSIEVYDTPNCPLSIELVEPLTLSPSEPLANQLITARYTVKNVGWRTISLHGLTVISRGPDCNSGWACPTIVDFPAKETIAIAPGQVYTYEARRRYGDGNGYFAQPAYAFVDGNWMPFDSRRLNFDVRLPTFSRQVSTGWNLLSIPIQSQDSTIDSVLSSLGGSHRLVYAYKGCADTDPWKSFDPNAPAYANDLDTIDSTQGFWVQMAASDSLHVAGNVPRRSLIPLCTGWNLVGFPSLDAMPLDDALNSISGCYSLVYTYDPTDMMDPWKKFDADAPVYANDLHEMKPGYGYWIRAMHDCLWAIGE